MSAEKHLPDALVEGIAEGLADGKDLRSARNLARALAQELLERRHAERSLRGELATWRAWAASLLGFAVDDGTARARIAEDLRAADRMLRSLRNVRALAARLVRREVPDAAHLLRFCQEAGVEGSILRGEGS